MEILTKILRVYGALVLSCSVLFGCQVSEVTMEESKSEQSIKQYEVDYAYLISAIEKDPQRWDGGTPAKWHDEMRIIISEDDFFPIHELEELITNYRAATKLDIKIVKSLNENPNVKIAFFTKSEIKEAFELKKISVPAAVVNRGVCYDDVKASNGKITSSVSAIDNALPVQTKKFCVSKAIYQSLFDIGLSNLEDTLRILSQIKSSFLLKESGTYHLTEFDRYALSRFYE